MRARGIVAALAFLFLAGALGGFVQPTARAADPSGAYGGDLNVALQGFTSTDPLLAALTDKPVLELIYDQLGRVDPVTLQVTPWAATGWTWDGDKNITVTLRDDLAWSDGTAYDADDVLYSFGRYLRGGVPRWDIVRVDAHTLRFDFTGIDAGTWNYETTNQAGPGLFWTEALTASIAWAQGSTQLRYSGPFAVSSYTAGSRLALVANEHHFSGRPYLDSVTYMWPYTADLDFEGDSVANDAGCALMFRQVHFVGWQLLTNDLTNLRDCTDFGGFPVRDFPSDTFSGPGLDAKWTWTNPATSFDVNATASGALHVVSSTGVNFDDATFTGNVLWNDVLGDFKATMKFSANPATNGQQAGLMVLNMTGTRDWYQVVKTNAAGTVNWQVRETLNQTTTNRANVPSTNPSPAWLRLQRVGNTMTASNSTDGRSWTTLDTYSPPFQYQQTMRVGLTFADGGAGTAHVVDVDSIRIVRGRESLLSTDQNRTVRHVLTAKNPGNDFLYLGFAQNGGSLFAGAPGTDGQKLRSAIYQFVNKLNYRDVEPNSAISHSTVNRIDTPWAPTNCPPWTPCLVVVDAGFTGTGTAKKTDSGPGTLALTMGGLVDRNGDGTRETSAGVPISFRILAPSFTLDPRKTTIAGDMEFLLRAAGLEVTTVVYDTWASLDAAIGACTTSCMYVKRYRSATTLPDWLMAMPEIRAANDPSVDLHLNLGGATAFSQETRALHVGHVNHYIGANADLLPVLHFDALEAFDFETFEGWVNMYGGINNLWSFTSLRLPALGALTARLSIFPTRSLSPGGTTDVQVEVRDEIGIPVAGAEVELSAGAGTFATAMGTTDGNGLFRTEYTAPAAVAEDADVWVHAVVTRNQYTGTHASGVLTLHRLGLGELQVAVARDDPEIESGGMANLTVQVRDAAGVAVSGAAVVLRTDLPGATISPATGTTDAGGLFRATITADVVQGMTYRVTAEVTMAGFADDSGSASLVVQPRVRDPPRIEVTKNVPGFEAMAAVGAIAVVFALVALARRRED